MSAEKLFNEVFERGLLKNNKEKTTKKHLELLLKNSLKGTLRPPALCFGDVMESLQSLNLESYEVSQVEPLHDLKGHIKNLWDLLPHHLPPEAKKIFTNEISIALGIKDTYRGCDYRLSVILIYSRLKGKVPNEIEELLYTLKELGRLAYLGAANRSPKIILRLYNVSFLHASRCIDVFGKNPKLAKIYGIYFHALTLHLPEHARIIAPSSLFTESEERIFNSLRGIGRDVTNRQKESIRDVGIVR